MSSLREAYGFGATRRAAVRGLWWVSLGLVLVGSASVALAASLVEVPGLEARVGGGPVAEVVWAFTWSDHARPPEVEQARRVTALARTTAAVALLVGLLAFALVGGLHLQRLDRLRGEHALAWALGAKPTDLVASLAGELAPPLTLGLALAAVLGGLVASTVEATFPARAETPLLAWFVPALIFAALLSVALRTEAGSGRRARIGRLPGWSLRGAFGSPPVLIAIAFTCVTGVGLLLESAPAAGVAGNPRVELVKAAIDAETPEERARVLAEWQQGRGRNAPPGLASAGTFASLGTAESVWVDCGRCFEGGMPLPLRVVRAQVHAVAPDTFQYLGQRVVEGRDFDDSDVGAPRVAIVSRHMASRYFEGGEALGRAVRVGDTDWLTVVGVVSDRPDRTGPRDHVVYLPAVQAAPHRVEILRPEAAGLARSVPGVRVLARGPASEAFVLRRWFAGLLAGLGGVALLLLVVGLPLAAANEARSSVYDVALRKAVGARARDLRTFVAARAVLHVAPGVLAGAWLSMFVGAGLHEASGAIPMVSARAWGVVAGLIVLAYAAGYFPRLLAAVRATPARAFSESAEP